MGRHREDGDMKYMVTGLEAIDTNLRMGDSPMGMYFFVGLVFGFVFYFGGGFLHCMGKHSKT